MKTSILQIQSFSKSYYIHQHQQHIQAILSLDLDVKYGEFVAIIGKSGSGKSTILKSIYRTNAPDKGSILFESTQYGSIDLLTALDQQIINIRRHEIGYVSQFLNILPRTTAFEYVKQSLLESDPSCKDYELKVSQILSHFELSENLWSMYPNTFSGGEKLRLNVAAAMIKKPRLLLLDEPTASLDANSKIKVKELISLLKQEGTSMIGIFHDIDFIRDLCDRVIHIEKGVLL